MSTQCLFQQDNNGSETEICKGIANDHENLECYFSIWEKLKNIEFGEMHISIASEIVASLALTGQYGLLSKFLAQFENETVQKLIKNERFLRAYIALKFEQKAYKDVCNLLENGTFRNLSGLLEVWDEAHYKQKENEIGKPLTPLIRFRIRKRNPPPSNICPSGERPSTKLTEASRKTLREWLDVNRDNPYPSQETRDRLASDTRLSSYQAFQYNAFLDDFQFQGRKGSAAGCFNAALPLSTMKTKAGAGDTSFFLSILNIKPPELQKKIKTWFANARRRLKIGHQIKNKYGHFKRHLVSDESQDRGNSRSVDRTNSHHEHDETVTNVTEPLEETGNDTTGCDSLYALASVCSSIGAGCKENTSQRLHLQNISAFNYGPYQQNQCLYPRREQLCTPGSPFWMDVSDNDHPVAIATSNLRHQGNMEGYNSFWSNCLQQGTNQPIHSIPHCTQHRYISTDTSSHFNSSSRPRSCPPVVTPEVSPVVPCWVNPPTVTPAVSPVVPYWQNQYHPECFMNITKPVELLNPFPFYRLPTDYQTVNVETHPISNVCIQNPVSEQEAAEGLLYLSGDKSSSQDL